MATIIPPPSKRQKKAHEDAKEDERLRMQIPTGLGNMRVQFVERASGRQIGPPISIPVEKTQVRNLDSLLNSLMTEESEDHESVPHRFSYLPNEARSDSDVVVASDLYNSVIKPPQTETLRKTPNTEEVTRIHFEALAVFKVQPVQRCSQSFKAHQKAILAAQFSPVTSSRLVTGSGDSTAKIIDCDTGTPSVTLKGHTSWVLVVAYSGDGSVIATGSYDNTVRLWDAKTGKPFGTADSVALAGHKKWITAIAWEPFHVLKSGRKRFASASKDGTARIWDAVLRRTDFVLARHTLSVTCVRWGGLGRIYTTSQDRTIGVWDANNGHLLKQLTGHAHRVNHIALSTDHVLRTAYHDPDPRQSRDFDANEQTRRSHAAQRFERAALIDGIIQERIVSASDDCTIYLWTSTAEELPDKPIARLTGHQKAINHVTFSPDGSYIASCGFENHVKLWRGSDGKFISTLRGHVAAVYQCSFSADSRLLVSCSKDTTAKVWDVGDGKLKVDLPGAKRELQAVDWSPQGSRVVTGGLDGQVQIWVSAAG